MSTFDAVWITNYGNGTVSVVDVATDAIVDTVSVGSGPQGIVSSILGDRVAVGCQLGNEWQVIDTTLLSVVETSALTDAGWVTTDPTGTDLYVTSAQNSPSGSVNQYAWSTYAGGASRSGYAYPTRFVISPDGTVGAFGPENANIVQFLVPSTLATTPGTCAIPSLAGDLAFSLDSHTLFVPCLFSSAVVFIDVGTLSISHTVTVGANPDGIAITPDGLTLYVANNGDNTVSVIDIGTHTVTNTLSVGVLPTRVAITADGSKAYVCNNGDNTVSVIDTSTFAVSTITGFSLPTDVAFAPALVLPPTGPAQAFVANPPDLTNTAFDISTYLPATSGVGTTASVLRVSPDGSKFYTVDQSDGLVTGQLTTAGLPPFASTTLPTPSGDGPLGACVSPDNTVLYVTDRPASALYVLDALTLANLGSSPYTVADDPYGIAVSPDGSTVYICQETGGTVLALETVGFTTVGTVTGFGLPINIVVSNDGSTAYCTDLTVPAVQVIDTATFTIIDTITLSGGSDALDLLLTPDGTYLYVVDGFASVAWQITTASNTVTDTLTLGGHAQKLAITPDSNHVWFSTGDIEVYAIPADTLVDTIAGPGYGAIGITPPAPIPPTTPVPLHRGPYDLAFFTVAASTAHRLGYQMDFDLLNGPVYQFPGSSAPETNPVISQDSSLVFVGIGAGVAWAPAPVSGHFSGSTFTAMGSSPSAGLLACTATTVYSFTPYDSGSTYFDAYDIASLSYLGPITGVGPGDVDQAFGLGISPDNNWVVAVWVGSGGTLYASIVDANTNTVSSTVILNTPGDLGPGGAFPVCFSPDSTTAYIGDGYSSNVWIVNIGGSLTGSFGVADFVGDMAITPDGAYLTVVCTFGGLGFTVSIVDIATSAVTDITTTCSSVARQGPSTTTAYVVDAQTSSLYVIDLASATITDTVALGYVVYGGAITLSGNLLYLLPNIVATTFILVVDLSTLSVTHIPVTNPGFPSDAELIGPVTYQTGIPIVMVV